MKRFLTIFLFSLLPIIGLTQDVSFSQINNNKLYLNPAFANSRNNPELTMSYRNHWPSLGSQYVTSMLTYEQSLITSKNGVGLLLLNDRSGNGIYSLNSINLYFSNQQRINQNSNIKFGIEFGYKQNFIDNNKLFFEDSFNGQSFTNVTNEPLMNGLRVHYFDIGAGVLYFNDKGFLGFAVNHINEPNQTLMFGDSYLPVKFGFHGGYNKIIKYSYIGDNIIYSPSFSILRQGEFTELTLNNNIKNNSFLFGGGVKLVEGFSYRNALIFNFGVDTKDLQFFYSYDFTISELGPNTGGAHEISTIIKISDRYKRDKIEIPSCAF